MADDHTPPPAMPAYPARLEISTAGCPWSSGCSRSRTTSRWVPIALMALLLVVVAWFAILFTSRYPREIFDFQVRTAPLEFAGAGVHGAAGDGPVPAVPVALLRLPSRGHAGGPHRQSASAR